MSSPAIYGGSRTKILTSKGLLLKDGTPIDFNGPKNYVTKGTFATNATTGWSLKRTTLDANKVPNQVAASWTNPSVLTLTATSTGALTQAGFSLSLAASAATTAGDMLVSDAYTIDKEDQAKVLNFKFSYQAYANASNLNFSGKSSNTFHVYIYDVVNNAWIQPTGCYTMVQNSGVGIGYGTFQTPANMTQFRIAIVSCNASAGAFTLYTDNFFVGPQQFVMGPPVTDWVSYTPTGSWTSNTTYTGKWRRVGDSMQIMMKVALSGAPTAASLTLGLPSGYSIDTTKINSTTVGESAFGIARGYDSGVTGYTGTVFYYSTTTVAIHGNNTGTWSNTVPFSWNAADEIDINFQVPIAGWSSNTVMSSDAATNVVALDVRGASAQSLTGNYAANTIIFNSVATDTNNSYNISTGEYTIPVSGYYNISAQIGLNNPSLIQGQELNITIRVDNDTVRTGISFAQSTATYNYAIYVEAKNIKLNAGQKVKITEAHQNASSYTLFSSNAFTFFNLTRVSGPAQIAASSVVAASASGTKSSTTTLDKITLTTITDSTNSFANNEWTVPVSGYYSIEAFGSFTTNNAVVNDRFLHIYIDGASNTSAITTNSYFGVVNIHTLLNLNAGQKISFYGQSVTIAGSLYSFRATIRREGGVM